MNRHTNLSADKLEYTALVNRNVRVDNRRTSMRLEQSMWDALEEISRRERVSTHQICTEVERNRKESSLTSAIRVYILNYYRAAATEEGHLAAGHGPNEPIRRSWRISSHQ